MAVLTQFKRVICSTLLLLPVLASAVDEPKGFYTIVDGQGRLIVIRTDDKTPKPTVDNVKKSPDVKASTLSVKQASSAAVPPVLPQSVTASQVKLNTAVPAVTTPVTKPHAKHQGTPVTQQIIDTPSAISVPLISTTIKKQTASSANDVAIPQQAVPAANLSRLADKMPKPQTVTQRKDSGLLDFDKTQYIDSQTLIDKGFNLDDKERFYAVPNNSGGVDYIEKKSGVNLKNILPRRPANALFSTSATYQRLNKKAIQPLLPALCVQPKMLAESLSLYEHKTLNIWPRPLQADDFQKNIVKLVSDTKELSLASYASSSNQPSYYWPLAIFLDANGCALEAAGGFYQADIQATWLQLSGIRGNLIVPDAAKYLMLTPLSQSPDMPNKKLTQNGQLRLSVYGTLP